METKNLDRLQAIAEQFKKSQKSQASTLKVIKSDKYIQKICRKLSPISCYLTKELLDLAEDVDGEGKAIKEELLGKPVTLIASPSVDISELLFKDKFKQSSLWKTLRDNIKSSVNGQLIFPVNHYGDWILIWSRTSPVCLSLPRIYIPSKRDFHDLSIFPFEAYLEYISERDSLKY